MTEFKSKFTCDINGFISLKEAFGTEMKPTLSHLKAFDNFCAEHYPNADNLTREIALGWLSYKSLRSKNKLESIIVRQLGKYLNAIGKMAYVLPKNFVLSKSDFTPYIPSNNELSTFFGASDSLKSMKKNPRAYVIAPVLFRLLYTCGLRPNEGRELKREDINFQSAEIIIRHNKQHRERIVVMSDDMLHLCDEYDVKRQAFVTDGVFFFPAYGNKPYTAQQLWSLFKTCWRLANPGIPEEKLPSFRPYDLRHCFASCVIHRWLDEERDIEAMLPYLRAYMGHETFNSTIYYVHLLPENLVRSAGIDLSKFENLLPEVENESC